jgi:hypothetical protein
MYDTEYLNAWRVKSLSAYTGDRMRNSDVLLNKSSLNQTGLLREWGLSTLRFCLTVLP